MAELWHYTRDGKQMDPVEFTELQRLARTGELRPNDMVWKEGMPDWIRAKNAPDLFASLGILSRDKAAPVPTKRTRPDDRDDRSKRSRRELDDAFDDKDEDRPRSRRRTRPVAKPGMSTPVIVGLLAAGGLVLFLMVIGGFLFFRAGGPNNNPVAIAPPPPNVPINPLPVNVPPGANVMLTYSVDLQVQGQDIRPIQLKSGNRYEFYAKAKMQNGDIDLFVMNNQGQDLARDEGLAADALVHVTAPYTGLFRIDVFNVGPLNNSATITVIDRGPSKDPPSQALPAKVPLNGNPPKIDVPKIDVPKVDLPKGEIPKINPPKGITPPFQPSKMAPPTGRSLLNTTGVLSTIGPRDPVRNQTFKSFNVELVAGKTYDIRQSSSFFDSYLRLENPQGQQVAADDDGGGYPHARILYTCPANGNYRIIATRLSAGRSGPFNLTVNEQ